MRAIGALCLVLLLVVPAGAESLQRPNVLFIAVDDLNHWIGHLERNKQTRTPNIDRLAKMGVTFTRSYCAAPVCNPSRTALMSGLRPGATGIYDNGQDFKPVVPVEKTLTTQFRKAGYFVGGAGKIYHSSVHRADEWDEYLDVRGKSEQLKEPKNGGVGGIRFAPIDCADDALPDFESVEYGIKHLQAKHKQPFFIAIGLHKPHMPWYVPKKYYDLFPLDKIELPPHRDDDLKDVPPAGVRMAKPDKDHAEILKSGRWKEAVQGYLAAIAYCDAQVGRLLDAYDKSAERDNTIIVFWGDHGWHLGEKQHWRKFALWEESTRMPYIWIAPGITNPGNICSRTVDLMSLYPTLCDLCGIDTPAHVQGKSIRSLLRDPRSAWDQPAITTFHQNNHAVRTERFRYIRYANGDEELYDHDRDEYEWTNLSSNSAFAADKEKLKKFLPTENAAERPRGKADE